MYFVIEWQPCAINALSGYPTRWPTSHIVLRRSVMLSGCCSRCLPVKLAVRRARQVESADTDAAPHAIRRRLLCWAVPKQSWEQSVRPCCRGLPFSILSGGSLSAFFFLFLQLLSAASSLSIFFSGVPQLAAPTALSLALVSGQATTLSLTCVAAGDCCAPVLSLEYRISISMRFCY